MSRVVVTGVGLVTPIGESTSTFLDSLLGARSGIRRVPESVGAGDQLVAGLVDFDPGAWWRPHQASQLDRATQFALVASQQALADATLGLSEQETLTAGVYWGTGLGGATSMEESYRQLHAGSGRVRPTAVVLGMNNAAAGQVSIANGLRGPLLNFSTACSSSATSVGEAMRAIRAGYADVVVAGGSEALVTNGNLRAWDAMQALAHADPLDPARSCKPFAADRTGIVLGEGAAALVLESADRAERRGAHIYAELVGYGNAGDASHISRPDAAGQVRAMRAGLADARVTPEDVDYVNAHGTATTVGDVVETQALREVFGAGADGVPVSSTKALHGHLMGATGATELLAAILAMNANVLPPTAHLDIPDPACDLDYVPNVAREKALDVVMSNSFGFGGMNAVLVARRYRP
ncbi:MAG TPA: beta-ketoacyl-[acyl-carrier-protein] synthase family protein [Gemmatimonadaceae bacterium]|nr:beta-ketoacyl-[acyl-carrier-protein] synthase family protein [Gemmatimonadaceae bacterium]